MQRFSTLHRLLTTVAFAVTPVVATAQQDQQPEQQEGTAAQEQQVQQDMQGEGADQTAAGQTAGEDAIDAGVISLNAWNYESLYEGQGWSVDRLFGTEVFGSAGDEIGNVEDLVIDRDGAVVALIAEVGGFWDIGDTHVSVPWDDAEVTPGESVTIPVTEETVEDFDLFDYSGLPMGDLGEDVAAGLDDEPLGEGLWRASDLIGDYVRVIEESGQGYVNYGYVRDMIVQDGSVAATVVSASGAYGRGYYAYPPPTGPGYPANWTPGSPAYDMPHIVGEIRDVPQFEYQRFEGAD